MVYFCHFRFERNNENKLWIFGIMLFHLHFSELLLSYDDVYFYYFPDDCIVICIFCNIYYSSFLLQPTSVPCCTYASPTSFRAFPSWANWKYCFPTCFFMSSNHLFCDRSPLLFVSRGLQWISFCPFLRVLSFDMLQPLSLCVILTHDLCFIEVHFNSHFLGGYVYLL